MGCKKDKKTLGPRYNPLESISGNWELYQASQSDTTTAVVEESDITDYYNKNNALAGFTLDKTSMTFQTDTLLKKHYIQQGSWSLDDPEYPSQLILSDGSGNNTAYRLVRAVRPTDDLMVLRRTVSCPNGDYLFNYTWTFKRKK
jgi:hypothetical protein